LSGKSEASVIVQVACLQGKGVQYYANGLFNLKSKDGVNFMKNNLGLLLDEFRAVEGFEVYVQQLEGLYETFHERGSQVYEANSIGRGRFNVLNHGDFHYNNLVFKKDGEGKISDVLFVSHHLLTLVDLHFHFPTFSWTFNSPNGARRALTSFILSIWLLRKPHVISIAMKSFVITTQSS